MYVDLNKELTDEQKAVKQRAHEFAAQVLRPGEHRAGQADAGRGHRRGLAAVGCVAHRLRGGLAPPQTSRRRSAARTSTRSSSHIVNEEWAGAAPTSRSRSSVTSFPFSFAAGRRDPKIIEEVVMPFVEDKKGRVHRLLGDHGAGPRLRHADARHDGTGPTRRCTTASRRRSMATSTCSTARSRPGCRTGRSRRTRWRSSASTASAAWRAAASRWCRSTCRA